MLTRGILQAQKDELRKAGLPNYAGLSDAFEIACTRTPELTGNTTYTVCDENMK
jgi:hypothetical protein